MAWIHNKTPQEGKVLEFDTQFYTTRGYALRVHHDKHNDVELEIMDV